MRDAAICVSPCRRHCARESFGLQRLYPPPPRRLPPRQGLGSADACMPEFPSDPDTPANLPYNIITMPEASLTVQPSVASIAECQAACSNNARCTYFAFYDYNTSAASSGSAQCFLRLQATAVEAIPGFNPTTSRNAILFELREGVYATFSALNAAEATAIGITRADGLTWEAARSACRSDASCIGMALSDTPNAWRTFAGVRWPRATAKVRAFGATLNSWVADSVTG